MDFRFWIDLTDKSICSIYQGIIGHQGSRKPLSLEVEPFSLEVEPLSLEVEPFSLEVAPLSLEVEPLSLEVAPLSLGVEPLSLEVEPFSLEVEPFSLEVAPLKDLSTKICFSCSEKLLISASYFPPCFSYSRIWDDR
ncbi:hypothetical protein [Nostoc sp.]|uniref:hypothetical protein n=1 Tax=Nostoc sp. TaxID=1180 RepID=UPI002FF5AB2F